MVKVRVPATSANIGPGFDSMGIALGLYNYVTAEENNSGRLQINILDDSKKFLPENENNLIYKSMKRVFEMVGHKCPGLKLTLENNIMITRGLGSSSAGIVGGIVAANKLSDIEGHPDNVTPALLGGFTVNVRTKYAIRYVKTELNPKDLCFAALVPDFYLQTKKSRGVLPKSVSHDDAVYNAGHSALLTASLMSGKYENIRTAVGDKLHQNYRKRLIPNMDSLFRLCYDNGALGVYLSGAGPTIMKDWKLHLLKPDNLGACIIENT